MSNNAVRSAFELVDAEPSNEFLSLLRIRLLADFAESDTGDTAELQGPNELPREARDEFVELAPKPSRLPSHRRLPRKILAAVACVAVVAIGAVIVVRAGRFPHSATELHDVKRLEALALAQRALISTGALGMRWTNGYSWGDSELSTQAAATISALPDCAVLRSVGLLPPTTKSATAHQFVPGNNLLFQQVFVFATVEDASRAMDVIDGAVFPTCWFSLFDRLTPLDVTGWTSTTEAWDVVQSLTPLDPIVIAPHGDRQIIIGQHTTVVRSTGPLERYFVNAFVQVGRTISWVDPRLLTSTELFDSSSSLRAVGINEAIAAATDALNRVLGR